MKKERYDIKSNMNKSFSDNNDRHRERGSSAKSDQKGGKSSLTSISTNSYIKRFLVDQMEMAEKHGYNF